MPDADEPKGGAKNLLYYGDNLDVLRLHQADESVDLVYLDPPFNSNANYNVLFAEHSGAQAASQIMAFEDTWHWDMSAAEAFEDVIRAGGRSSEAMQAFMVFLGPSDMMAYLSMMAPRLIELRRVLRPSGSIYLHCDPSASHYLKMLMDAVFGPTNFRNEIVWQRTGAHSDAHRFGRVNDSILFYTKTDTYTFNPVYTDYDPEYVAERYRYSDESGRLFWPNTMTAAGPGPSRTFRGVEMPPPPGTHWRFAQKEIDRLEAEGGIYYSSTGKPYVKSFLDERKGRAAQSLWNDIVMSKSGKERLGFPTQKPVALLERILAASSNEGDVVLDPFCGCGTTIAAAQKLNRRWVGIDVTSLAITLIRHRLRDNYGPSIDSSYEVLGEPVSVPDAEELAAEDPYQFQWWALDLVGARPAEQKKGADKGIDGQIYFMDEPAGGKVKSVIISVKAGHTGRHHVHELRGVIEREGAAIGALISMQEPTKPMREEAASAGFYRSEHWRRDFARIQLLTVADLLEGKVTLDYPPAEDRTFRKGSRVKADDGTGELPFDKV